MGSIQNNDGAQKPTKTIKRESDLAALASLFAGDEPPMTVAEKRLCPKASHKFQRQFVVTICNQIKAGGDPLGEAFCQLRTPEMRRSSGATYTPHSIVNNMVAWAAGKGAPIRIVDPGAGSGRFLFAAARRFPAAMLIAIEIDPLARLILRANAAVLGYSERLTVVADDFRGVTLPKVNGPTLYIGNPPYVRHHNISQSWKNWFAKTAANYGFKASRLAGLHIHFFLKTRQLACDGDYGAFITSAEWLDVNYGSLLRKLLANGLGGIGVQLLSPNVTPFSDAFTTGAITYFCIGHRASNFHFRTVHSLDDLRKSSAGKVIPWAILEKAIRWSPLTRPVRHAPSGHIKLGELFAVHRGQVTGANDVWTATDSAFNLPAHLLQPAVTKARELLAAGAVLGSDVGLRRIVDLPVDLDELSPSDKKSVENFLTWAQERGADQSYVARHRRAWWAIALYDPAPILCTYMARRSPAFVRNLCNARHLNIAHGLYPREPMSDDMLMAVIAWLRDHISVDDGRTYAGGLTKFEPRELERLPIPRLENLQFQ